MSYIGNTVTSVAFVTDSFSGNASTTAFTMSVAPANTSSALVAISGVLQDPTTYSVSGLTLTFTSAPPVGTGNISVRYLGIPASGVTTTAYRTVTEFTATSGQTTFTPPSYSVGYINVFRNGVRLASADFTASNGTTVVLTNAATTNDIIMTESFYVSSVSNAIPNTNGAVGSSLIADGNITSGKLASGAAVANIGARAITTGQVPAGSVIQVVTVYLDNVTTVTTSTSFVTTSWSGTITPTSATSKILVTVSGGSIYCGTGSGGSYYATIYRNNSTNLGNSSFGLERFTTVGGTHSLAPHSMSVLDSPATTSATTYTPYFRNAGSATQVDFSNTDRGIVTMTLMEIAV
jgi:hypothetical protein